MVYIPLSNCGQGKIQENGKYILLTRIGSDKHSRSLFIQKPRLAIGNEICIEGEAKLLSPSTSGLMFLFAPKIKTIYAFLMTPEYISAVVISPHPLYDKYKQKCEEGSLPLSSYHYEDTQYMIFLKWKSYCQRRKCSLYDFASYSLLQSSQPIEKPSKPGWKLWCQYNQWRRKYHIWMRDYYKTQEVISDVCVATRPFIGCLGFKVTQNQLEWYVDAYKTRIYRFESTPHLYLGFGFEYSSQSLARQPSFPLGEEMFQVNNINIWHEQSHVDPRDLISCYPLDDLDLRII